MFRTLLPLALMALTACTTTAPMSSTTPTPPVTDASATTTAADPGDYDPRLHAAPTRRPSIPSPVIVPLDAGTLARLPREPVTATAHEHTMTCDGIPLLALLRATGAMPAEPLKGPQLTRYVQVDARDGYRALYALAELDPTLGNHTVFLTDRCDGKPLNADDGPLRLVAPGEQRPARWVRQVKSVTVIVAP